jgi:hypothetical protein
MTPQQRSLRSRIGGLATAGKNDPREYTAPARTAFLAKFEAEADPDGILPPKERARRAEALRKAHFTRMAFNRERARTAKREQAQRGA